MPRAPQNAELYNTPLPRLVLVGRSGAGKSSSGNRLSGEQLFQAAGSAHAVTTQCHAYRVRIGGAEAVLMDSPGFGDSRGRDTAQTRILVDECRRFNTIHWWLLVVKAQDMRVDGPARDMMTMLTRAYGNDFLDHVMLCVTFWDYGDRAERRRLRGNQTAMHLQQNWQEVCREQFGRGAQFSLPMLFLDNLFDGAEPDDVAGFQAEVGKLAGYITNARPYQTGDAQHVQTRVDEQKQQLADYENAFQLDIKWGQESRVIQKQEGMTARTSVGILKSRVTELYGFSVTGNWWLSHPSTSGGMVALADGYDLGHYGVHDGSRIVVVGNAMGGPGMLGNHKAALRNSPTKTMMGVGGIPTHRMCPRCYVVVQHMGGGCKAVVCPKCSVQFCMSCLGVASAGKLPCGGHGDTCTVAPRQDVSA